MEILFVKTLGILKPAYEQDAENVKRLPNNALIKGTFTVPRNPKYHRKFFALLNLVLQNQEIYKNIDDLRGDLIIEAGYFEEYTTLHGEIKKKPKSISWAKMDELEFEELFDKVCNVICEYIIPGIEKEEIRNTLIEIMPDIN